MLGRILKRLMSQETSAEQSLKEQALSVMDEVERSELERDLKETKPEAKGWTKGVVTKLLKTLSDADADAAALRVAKLQQEHSEAGPDELCELIIKKKAQQTAAIGAASSGAALVPVVGTLSALTVGVAADITATFKLQAEMVLEIAAAYDFPLDELDEQKVIFLVTGVSTGGNILLNRVGKDLSLKLSERYAQKWLATALPFIGVVASSSTNGLSTYVIGQRAQTYFKHGPEAVDDWKSSLRTLAGVDERKLGGWLSETGAKTWGWVADGAQKTGAAVADVATSAGESVAAGAAKTVQGASTLGTVVGDGVSDAAVSVAETTAGIAGRVGDVLKTPWRKRSSDELAEAENDEEV